MMIPSSDGTQLACTVTGAGPGLLLVHGSGTGAVQFAPLRPVLKERFTLAAFDRRGHGASGDAPGYALAREAEDIAAVLAATGARDVVAHSYGGICALAAALAGAPIRRLALYEAPVVTRPGAYFRPELIAGMRAAIDAGDGDGALTAFATVVRGASLDQLDMMRRMPGWAERCAHAHVLLRELEAVAGFRPDPVALRALDVPVLLLRGELSPSDYVATADALSHALPDVRLHILPGQRHGAIETAPALVAEALAAFFVGSR
jgi:pimeloyl-ACP methyl ester carboxylesterase